MITRTFAGTVAELHARAMPTEGEAPELWVMQPSAPAIAMGSSQRPALFDESRLAAHGVELAPRRSGGGAVFIDPARTVWIDLLAPRSSRWWSSELSQNFMMVGAAWQQALASLAVDTDLCAEAPRRTEAAALACWAGRGWGELTVGPDHAKVVGLSQRRTRWGCRVQAMAVLDGSSARVGDYVLAPNQSVIHEAIPTTTVAITVAALQAAVLDAFECAPQSG